MEILTPKLKRIRPLGPCSQAAGFSAFKLVSELAEGDSLCFSTTAQPSQHFAAVISLPEDKQVQFRRSVNRRLSALSSCEVALDSASSFLDLWRAVEAQLEADRKQSVVEDVEFLVPVAAMNAKFLRKRADELNLNTTGRYLPYLLSNELHVSTIDEDMQNWVHASIPVMEVLESGGPFTLAQPFKAQITVNRVQPPPLLHCVKAKRGDGMCSDDDMEYMPYTPFDATYPHLAKLLYSQQASLLVELTHNHAKIRAFCITNDEGDAIGDKKANDSITDALSSLEQSVRLRQTSSHSHHHHHAHPASPITAVHPMPLEHSFPFVVKLLYTLARQSAGSLVVIRLAETASIHLRWRHSANPAQWEEYCVVQSTGAASAQDALVKLEEVLTEQERLTAGGSQFDMEVTRSPGSVRMI